MAEQKPGLLKRIFSFGFGSRQKEAKDEPPAQDRPEGAQDGHPPAAAPPESPSAAAVAPAPAATDSTKEEAAGKRKEPVAKPSRARRVRKDARRQAVPTDAPQEVETPAPPPAGRPRELAATRKKSAKSGKTAARPPVEPPPLEKPEDPASISAAARNAPPGTEDLQTASKPAAPTPPPAPAIPPSADEGSEPDRRRAGWFQRLRKGLSKTSNSLVGNVAAVFTTRRLDEAALQDLEDVLVQADLGVETAMNITDVLSARRLGKEVTDTEIRSVMAEEIARVLDPVARPLELDLTTKPHVILVVGVNGSGKTTTIGKLSAKLRRSGYSTLLVAGDTFRAAAIEQLKIWGERTSSEVAARQIGSDAAALAYDAYSRARQEGHDVMLMDTAGRLQNKKELMAELEKIIRVLRKQDPAAPHTVLLTLDATTGQNALSQVEIFGEVAGVNGLVMTKLDGTARGGILVAIAAKFGLPVYFIGVGEQVDDLEPFEAREFADSIAGVEHERSLAETD